MSRLSDLYPLTLLEINYRCHPQILDWPVSAIYKDKITASEQNVMADRVGNAWDTFVSSLYHFKRAGSTSWCNDEHISVVITFLRALHTDRSSNDRIGPSDVVLICPYKEQVKRVNQRFAQEGVKYDRCLTIDGSQGQEANVIIFIFTKPRTSDESEVGFLASYHRLNVALTRTKKLLILVANLGIWNKRWAGAAKNGSTRYLGSFLTDAFAKNDILKWEGTKTVTERVDGTQKPKAIVSMPASSMRKAPSAPKSAAPPRKASPVTRPPASPRNVEQSGAVGVAPDSKVIGGEAVKITSSLEQLKLDREALEAEQIAMNERWTMLDAMLAKWNAE
ncbi:uncharacterized protein N7479_009731 [Penicillium vulpinum]|nr:uncharacterized protein N7479_009731 [Penicillium vulpinum]KAJ5951318.1 hypothetical protein N7479_009731 [Penicillium vulpinum]